jgi:bifunctional DNase/RNase
MIQVVVARLGLDSTTQSYVIVLRERGGDRLLPIWIGQAEAESIVVHMHQMKHSRPLTHDLCTNLIQELGGTLTRIQITRVSKNTYFAELHIERDGSLIRVDARPSDSIAIALRMDAPVYVADELLLDPDEDTDNVPGATSAAEQGEPQMDDAEQLKEYLSRLRPEDFGKFQP